MSRDSSTGIQRSENIDLFVDQKKVSAYAGETLATLLLAQGITTFNRTAKGQPRGPYCNMGTCFECQVQMAHQGGDTFSWVRACMTEARPGMSIITGATLMSPPGRATVVATSESDNLEFDSQQSNGREANDHQSNAHEASVHTTNAHEAIKHED